MTGQIRSQIMRQIRKRAEDPHNNTAANPDAAGVHVDLQNCRWRVAELSRLHAAEF